MAELFTRQISSAKDFLLALSEKNQSGTLFRDLEIRDRKFSAADLSKCTFWNCDFRNCQFDGSNFWGNRIMVCNWVECSFNNCDFRECQFRKVNLSMCKIKDSHFEFGLFRKVQLQTASMENCALEKTMIYDTSFRFAKIASNFVQSDLISADFTGANLTGSIFAPMSVNQQKVLTRLIEAKTLAPIPYKELLKLRQNDIAQRVFDCGEKRIQFDVRKSKNFSLAKQFGIPGVER